MAKRKDTSVEIAFNEFDTLVDTFFKETAASLQDLQKPSDPKQPKIKQQPRLPNMTNPFRI